MDRKAARLAPTGRPGTAVPFTPLYFRAFTGSLGGPEPRPIVSGFVNNIKPGEHRQCQAFTGVDPLNGTDECKISCGFDMRFCSKHLLLIENIQIGFSRHLKGGLGLFAGGAIGETKRDIIFWPESKAHAASVITTYNGELMSTKDLNDRWDYKDICGNTIHPTAMYAVSISPNKHIDACIMRSAGAYINDPRGGKKKGQYNRANCAFRVNEAKGVMEIIAIRNIHRGEELLIRYGDKSLIGNAYWDGVKPDHVVFATVRLAMRSSTIPPMPTAKFRGPRDLRHRADRKKERLKHRNISNLRSYMRKGSLSHAFCYGSTRYVGMCSSSASESSNSGSYIRSYAYSRTPASRSRVQRSRL